MTGLSVQAIAALSQAFERVPEDHLGPLSSVVRTLPGAKARDVEKLLDAALLDRRRRREALGAVLPLFSPRADGIAATVFPRAVLARLWGALCVSQAQHLSLLDGDDEDDAGRRAMVRARMYRQGVVLLRHDADSVWPAPNGETAEEAAARLDRAEELARCFEIGVAAHAAVRDLKDWLGRRDEDAMIGLRLALRDSATVEDDGVRRFVELLTAHLSDPGHILQLTVMAAQVNGGEALLPQSELAGQVERVLQAVEDRADRIVAALTALSPRGQAAARRDGEGDVAGLDPELAPNLTWTSAAIEAVDLALSPGPASPWGVRLTAVRSRITKALEARLDGVGRAVLALTPVRDVPLAGRMKRKVPDLDRATDPAVLRLALTMADLVAAVRSAAARFGVESRRQALVASLTQEVSEYGDLILEAIQADEVADMVTARLRTAELIDVLDRIEAETDARTLRRRMASACPIAA